MIILIMSNYIPIVFYRALFEKVFHFPLIVGSWPIRKKIWFNFIDFRPSSISFYIAIIRQWTNMFLKPALYV